MAAIHKAPSAAVFVTCVTGSDGVTVVSIAGELDTSNVDEVRRQLEATLAASSTALVVDLSKLGFMDSSGLALLVQVAARVETISLRHVPALIQRLLDATSLSDILAAEK
ncbi:MAG TPA: STAS domain-containing protein [Acidimicrobiales bacterium]